VLGIEEGKVVGNGLLECAAWERSRIFLISGCIIIKF